MKLSKTKKINKEFDPNRDWYMLLLVIVTIFFCIAGYAFYRFLYIKNEISLIEIESKNNIQNSVSVESLEKIRNDNKFLKDINNLNKILDNYAQKEIDYNKLVNIQSKLIVNISTSTSSTTVATSTQ